MSFSAAATDTVMSTPSLPDTTASSCDNYLSQSLPSQLVPSFPHIVTCSMTGNSRPEDFSDFHIYFSKSTKHPLKAMFTTTLPHPITFSQAVSDPQWCTAMENELNALLENGTGLLWPRPLDQNVIRNKWVFKLKQKPDGTIER